MKLLGISVHSLWINNERFKLREKKKEEAAAPVPLPHTKKFPPKK